MGYKWILWFLPFFGTLSSEGSATYFIYREPNIKLERNKPDYLVFSVNPTYEGISSKSPGPGIPECVPQRYVVHYSEKDENVWHPVDSDPLPMGLSTQVTISHLMPGKSYFLRIIGCCPFCQSNADFLNVTDAQIFRSGPHMTPPPLTLSYELFNNRNTLRLMWNIYVPSFGQIMELKLKLNHTRIACQQIMPVNKTEFDLSSYNLRFFELPLEPYSRYNATLYVKGSLISFFSGCFGEEFETRSSDITDNEKLSIREIVTTTSEATVYFKEFDCQNVNGPLCVNYHLYSSNHARCGRLFSSSSSEGPFPSQLNIKGLRPYCNYTVQIWLTRICSEQTNRVALDLVIAETKATVFTEKVRELAVTSRGPAHISLRWLPPENVTGRLKKYQIHLFDNTSVTNSFYTFAVNVCSLWPKYHCHKISFHNSPAHHYTIWIFGINENTVKYTEAELNKTKAEGRVGQVETQNSEAKPQGPYNVKANWTSNRLLNVSWNHPNATNGQVKYFKIYIDIIYSQSIRNSSDIYTINDASQYKFEYFKVLNLSFFQRKKVRKVHLCVVTQNSYFSSECKSLDKALLPLVPMAYEKLIIYDGKKVVIPNPDIDDFLEEIFVFTAPASAPMQELKRELDTLHKAIEGNYFDHKKTLPGFNELLRKNTFESSHELEQFSRQENMFIHRVLGFETEYLITLFIVNDLNGKRTVARASQLVQISEKKTSIYGIIGVIFAVLLIIPLLIYLIFRYRHKLFKRPTRIGSSIVQYLTTDDNAPLTSHEILSKSFDIICDTTLKTTHSRPVRVETLRNYIKTAIESNELFKQHQLFPRSDTLMKQDPRFTCTYGSLPQNKAKNRYNNIVAYDHTRVKLNKRPGDDFSDYINANYIDGYKIPKAYIATQGPKPNTLTDFWTMIWENNVKHIVMLTNLYDGEKKNCEQYWPNENDILNFEGFKVQHISTTIFPTYDVRELRLKFGGGARKVVQMHFKMWPPLGQPLFPQTLVPLMKKTLTVPYSTQSPILVHCSAGIGRTGTIILCDICLRMAAAEGVVDILGTLESLRNQRPNMVDNVEQYKLAHLVILDTLTAWNNSIPCDGNFESAVELTLDRLIPSQLQYIKESEWQDDAMKTVANAVQKHVPIVQEKNRYPDILPDEICQVFLQQIPQQGPTSCYINAVRVNSFLTPNKYIVTQHPVPHTVVDFWRMVFEQQVTIVVNIEAQDSPRFWPDQQNRMDINENMEIRHVKTINDKEISIHKLMTSYRPDDFEQTRLTVQIVSFNGWPMGDDAPRNIEDFVSFVVDSASIAKNLSPIIVTCHDGATASGLFVALSNLIEQMETEKMCDVCQTVRSLRICRKQFVNKEGQIKLLYQAALVYARVFGVYNELEL